MADIRISEAAHAAPADRAYTYDPTFIMRRLSTLPIACDPIHPEQPAE
jgi:hypothetical protein